MVLFILKPEFTNSTDFFKKCEQSSNIFFSKFQNVLFSKRVFYMRVVVIIIPKKSVANFF